ncbi:hypothetical protein Dimus_013364 [Dionaea muscipula]
MAREIPTRMHTACLKSLLRAPITAIQEATSILTYNDVRGMKFTFLCANNYYYRVPNTPFITEVDRYTLVVPLDHFTLGDNRRNQVLKCSMRAVDFERRPGILDITFSSLKMDFSFRGNLEPFIDELDEITDQREILLNSVEAEEANIPNYIEVVSLDTLDEFGIATLPHRRNMPLQCFNLYGRMGIEEKYITKIEWFPSRGAARRRVMVGAMPSPNAFQSDTDYPPDTESESD